MLHFDRETQAYLNALDANFKSTPRISEGVETTLNKVFADIEYDWEAHYNRVQKGMSSFTNKLKDALSDPIPSKLVGRKRPPQRKFPFQMPSTYMDHGVQVQGGGLKESVYYDIDRIKHSNNTWEIIVEYGARHVHADWTNIGRGSGTNHVQWRHWADRVFRIDQPAAAVRHSSKVPDIRGVLLGYYGNYRR